MLPHSIGYYRGIGQCIGRRKSRNLKQTFSLRIKRKEPDFLRNQVLFGGDYWTRTSDLLRVKIRLDGKGLLSGAFRYFLLHFFRTGKRSSSTVSTRCYPDIGQRIGQVPGSTHWAGPGTLSAKGGRVSVMAACNRETVKCCFRFRQPAVRRPYRTAWWGNVSLHLFFVNRNHSWQAFCRKSHLCQLAGNLAYQYFPDRSASKVATISLSRSACFSLRLYPACLFLLAQAFWSGNFKGISCVASASSLLYGNRFPHQPMICARRTMVTAT